jgi:hypothetical protein
MAISRNKILFQTVSKPRGYFETQETDSLNPSSALSLLFAPLRQKAFSRKGASKERPKPQRVELRF